jgi:voltage-gated potassium channel
VPDTIPPGLHAPETASTRLARAAQVIEWPLVVLALLVVPALLLESRAQSPVLRTTAVIANWAIWTAFCVDFGIRWAAAGRLSYLRDAWFDAVLIVVSPPVVPDFLQGTRSLRALRALRLIRSLAVASMGLKLARRLFGRNKFQYVALLAVALVFLGALAVFTVEVQVNPAIAGYGDALWWAAVTTTTVGYGDVAPVTLEGRIVAVGLMIVGIGVIGVFTATVASFFFEQEQESDTALLHRRLDDLDRKVNELLRRSSER